MDDFCQQVGRILGSCKMDMVDGEDGLKVLIITKTK
jgi:hypothetical protein